MDETITAIAGAHGVSAAQVILRWDLQRGVVVIPGSSNPDHIRDIPALLTGSWGTDKIVDETVKISKGI